MTTPKKKGGRTTPKKEKANGEVFTPAQLLAMKQPIRIPVDFIVDSFLADQRAEAEVKVTKAREALERAKITGRLMGAAEEDEGVKAELLRVVAAVDEAEAELEEITAECERKTLRFVVKALSPDRRRELYAEHPPSDEDQANFEDDLRKAGEPTDQFIDFDPATFPKALIAEALVTPELTAEEVEDMYTSGQFSTAEMDTLFVAAVNANKIIRS